jgi:hypothetical protein
VFTGPADTGRSRGLVGWRTQSAATLRGLVYSWLTRVCNGVCRFLPMVERLLAEHPELFTTAPTPKRTARKGPPIYTVVANPVIKGVQ